MSAKPGERAAALGSAELGRLHDALSQAETVLLYATVPDASLKPLQDRAAELSCGVLATLGQLRRRLAGEHFQPETRETLDEWAARQASSGRTHEGKPNPRGSDGGAEWAERRRELKRIRERAA